VREDQQGPAAGAGAPVPASNHPGDAGAHHSAVPPRHSEQLRDIRSIIDAALSALDPQALLEVLVQRVKEALQADTAAILLLDPSSYQLVATAASGLEEEVQQGVRIPVGKGFAGRIAAQGRPVVLEKVDHTTVVNPILLDKRIRSLMGAPLLVGGEVLGVLHVGTLSPRAFTSDDVDLLQLAADRAAVAVQALTAHLDRAAARAVQLSLLPFALPAVGGLEMAARYVPGTGKVGGDWYDVFPLPSGGVCVVIGDVTGSGLHAAVIMSRIRSALRAYALETADPAEIISRLDRKLRYFEPDVIATVLCTILSPSQDQVHISSAGHLPPIIAAPGQPGAPANIAADLPVGVPGRQRRRVTSLGFPPGAVLCLYTDGLVERRDQPIDAGIARLRATVTAGDPEAGCTAVMAAMARYSTHSDDIALLMIYRNPGPAGDSGTETPAPAHAQTTPHQGVHWSGRHAIVTMPLELDITNSPEVSELLAAVIGQSPEVITADMTATTFCDSAGVHTIARANELAAARGSELRLALGDAPAARMFQLTGLDQIVPVYPDLQRSLDTPPARPGKRA
jgi:phosphoserine phosphatase RsbU/P